MPEQHLVTAHELEALGKPEPDVELVRGELVPVTPAGMEQGRLAGRIAVKLGVYAEPRRLGSVYVAETGFRLFQDPDTVRAPDVAFISAEREAGLGSRRGFFPGAPDLAVEIRSPDQTLAELEDKAREYLDAGARLVWLVAPPTRTVRVYAPGAAPTVRSMGDLLDGGSVLPGFALPVAELFRE